MRWLTKEESESLEMAATMDAQGWADYAASQWNNKSHFSQTGGANPWKSLEDRKLVFNKEIVRSTCGTISVWIVRPTPIALLIRAALKNLDSQSNNGTSL